MEPAPQGGRLKAQLVTDGPSSVDAKHQVADHGAARDGSKYLTGASTVDAVSDERVTI